MLGLPRPRFLRARPRLRFHWLTDDLAFSRAPLDDEWETVRRAGIRCVVDLRAEVESDGERARQCGLLYLRLPVEEGAAPDGQTLLHLADWIGRGIAEHGRVLVHCREGLGRSPLVACAALVRMGLPVTEAYAALRRARPGIALSDAQAVALERFAELVRAPG
jgi:protein-tyrosine phosphatase